MAVFDDETIRIITEEMRRGKTSKQLSAEYSMDIAKLQKLAKKLNDSKHKKKESKKQRHVHCRKRDEIIFSASLENGIAQFAGGTRL